MTTEEQVIQGRVIRSVRDHHTVATAAGKHYSCRTRGRLRVQLLPGDFVRAVLTGPDEGLIEAVAERKTELIRPRIANVDQAVVVMALEQPPPALHLLDRFLIMSERERLRSVIIFTKADLNQDERFQELALQYAGTGYPVIKASTKTNVGIDDIKYELEGRLSVLAGPSGVGKSSLLNAVLPGVQLETGAVSDKLGRGRHTTRLVNLLPLEGGGWVADSPGFTTLDLTDLDPRHLPQYYPDISRFAGHCHFTGCLHKDEPRCYIKQLVDEGQLSEERYTRYLDILQETIDLFERRF